MKKWIFILLLFPSVCYAALLPKPALDKGLSKQTQQFLDAVYNNFSKLEVITTNPNNNRSGDFGDMVMLNSSGTYYLEVCTSPTSGSVWRGVQLTFTP